MRNFVENSPGTDPLRMSIMQGATIVCCGSTFGPAHNYLHHQVRVTESQISPANFSSDSATSPAAGANFSSLDGEFLHVVKHMQR